MADSRATYQLKEETLRRMLARAEAYVSEHGPSTTADLERVMRRPIIGGLRVTRPSDINIPPAAWILHHSTTLTVVDQRDSKLLWTDDADDDSPGIRLSEGQLTQLFGGEPVPAIPIREVVFNRYRSLWEASVSLGPLTLLVGPNGSGKSNLLDGLFRLLRLADFATNAVFGGPAELDALQSFGAAEPTTIQCRGGGGESFTCTWQPHANPQVFLNGEPVDAPRNSPVARAFGPARLVDLDPEHIAEPAYSEALVPAVDARGRNVAAVLADTAATDPNQFHDIIERIRETVPSLEAIRIPRARLDSDEGPLFGHALEAKLFGHWVPSHQLSEGTLMMIALQTILATPRSRPRVLLLDDLDRGLHPKAQQVLAEQLKRETASGSLQVVASTHSPFVLDTVDPSCVRMVQINEEGHTQVAPLDGLPEWDEWRDQMTAGEFWMYAGPDWAAK